MDSEHTILSLLEDDPGLTVLEDMLAEFDAFAFLRLSDREEIHSRVLAWLLDPQESHSAGSFFLKNFLHETASATEEQILGMDWSNTSIRQEWFNVVDGQTGYLDILIQNAEISFVCGIENKVFSREHSLQLHRYRRALEDRFPNYSISYLFLSPGGDSPSDASWKPVKYETVMKLAELTQREGLRPDNESVASFLRQYVTTLRRNIVPDTELKQLATSIYLRHRKALDFILTNKDSYLGDVMEICSEAIGGQSSWRLLGEREGKLFGFIEKSWEGFDLFHTGNKFQAYDRSPLLLLDFDLRQTGRVVLNLTLCSGNDAGVRELLFEGTYGQYPELFNPRTSEKGGRLLDSHTRLYESEPILSESDFRNWDKAEAREKIQIWTANFAEEEFPAMNEILCSILRKSEA